MRIALKDPRWWLAEGAEELARHALEAARDVSDATRERQDAILAAFCMYGDSSALSGMSEAFERNDDGEITRNVLATATDTILSEVTQTRPRPMFVTIGGTWFDQQRARKLTHFCDALFSANDVHDLAEQATRDALITGLGILRPYICPITKKRVRIERIFPGHFLVDDRGAVSVVPRCYYVRHLVDRWHLAEIYPEHREVIEQDQGVDAMAWYADVHRSRDVVEVIEAIHLPSRADKSDGRQVLVIKDAVLFDEPYEHDDPPFAFVRAIKPVSQFWGASLLMRAAPTQAELNKLLVRIQEAQHLLSVPLIFLPRQCGVTKAHLTNGIGNCIDFDGPTPPVFYTPTAMGPEVYQYAEVLESKIYQQFMVSELSAKSVIPRGMGDASGRALQVYNDVQSRRFIGLERGFEGLHTTLALLVVRLEKQIANDHPDHEVAYADGGRTDLIKWSEIEIDDDRYRCDVFPASAFPRNPAAKIQMLQGMLSDGTIDLQAFYELALDVPDLEAIRNRIVAPIELIHKRLAEILYNGHYLAPEPYMDLKLALKEAALIAQRAEIEGAPEERLEDVRLFMADCKALMKQLAAEEAASAPPGMPPMPPGMPPPGGESLVPPETLPGMPPLDAMLPGMAAA